MKIELKWYEKLIMNILKQGKIPRHVAFIMDGNRRWATQHGVKKSDGHKEGVQVMNKCIECCKYLGVREVTVYALSVENLKRSQEELEVLFKLAEEAFTEYLNNSQNGINYKIMGKIDLLPIYIQQLCAKLNILSKNDSEFTVNVACSYTSREEITNSLKSILEGIESGELHPEDINESLIEECLYNKSPVDLLVRTSGETRLSDFLLWQSSSAVIYFTSTLWPDLMDSFSPLKAILYYQKHWQETETMRQNVIKNRDLLMENQGIVRFLKELKNQRFQKMTELANKLVIS